MMVLSLKILRNSRQQIIILEDNPKSGKVWHSFSPDFRSHPHVEEDSVVQDEFVGRVEGGSVSNVVVRNRRLEFTDFVA